MNALHASDVCFSVYPFGKYSGRVFRLVSLAMGHYEQSGGICIERLVILNFKMDGAFTST